MLNFFLHYVKFLVLHYVKIPNYLNISLTQKYWRL